MVQASLRFYLPNVLQAHRLDSRGHTAIVTLPWWSKVAGKRRDLGLELPRYLEKGAPLRQEKRISDLARSSRLLARAFGLGVKKGNCAMRAPRSREQNR